ncbi:beta-ketoacyl synthase N-terminal-like domain-containing protein [Actinosynnema sp. CA-299493]
MSESDIAVIGLACRVPGASSVDGFWRNLAGGVDSATFLTDEQVASGAAPDLATDPRYVPAGQFLDGVELFDAAAFRITDDEAEILDPQHRLFLECSLEALESAGYRPGDDSAAIGVYAGAGMNTYLLHNLRDRYRMASSAQRYRMMLAGDKDFLAMRVSYKLDLRGPSMSVNTACSTSLVALHAACVALLGGDCDVALAGAVSLNLSQGAGYLHQEGMVLSPDGRCRAFDERAAGTVHGSGVGVVVLKRLADALADGDFVHAVVKGTAVNNDGAAKAGFTAPSAAGQAAVIRAAQQVADVTPSSITYVEAHGTGTPLGDPVEVAALNEAFAGSPHPGCALGSVKTNVGHLDAAAGMAGLIKVILQLRHRTLVPSLHFATPNPRVDFASGPFHVNARLTEWKSDGPLRAGVSCFGVGGTNAHAVLEQAPPRPPGTPSGGPQLLVLSARSETALDRLTTDLARHLKRHPDLSPADVAHTLAVGRSAHRHRRALVCSDLRDAALTLALGDAARVVTGDVDGPVAVVFAVADRLVDGGGHAVELYRRLPAYRALVDAVVGNGEEALSAGDDRAAFLAHLALARLLGDWGVRIARFEGGDVARRVADASTAEVPEDLVAGTRPVVFDPWAREPGTASLLHAIGELWAAGAEVDWSLVRGAGRRVPLPTTPWERTRHWVEPDVAVVGAGTGDGLRERLERAPEEHRLGVLIDFVSREVSRVLGREEPADPDRNLFELGLDSLILIDITARLGDELRARVEASAFVEHPTIRAFAEHHAHLVGATPVVGAGRDGRTSRRAAARREGSP